MRGQPQPGLCRFIATTASMSSVSGPFGPGRWWRLGENNSVLSFAQQAVKMQQGGRLQSNSGTEDTCRADEERAQSHDDPIGGSQIGSTFATSTEDQHLMPNQHGFGNNGTESTRSCESRQGHHQMKQ